MSGPLYPFGPRRQRQPRPNPESTFKFHRPEADGPPELEKPEVKSQAKPKRKSPPKSAPIEEARSPSGDEKAEAALAARPRRDAEALAKEIRHNTSVTAKLLLGLDLATNTGYAYAWVVGDVILSVQPHQMGQLDLSASSFDSGAVRFMRLWRFLDYAKPAAIVMENKEFAITNRDTPGRAQVSAASFALSAAFRATVANWAEQNSIPLFAVQPATLKKHATGKGNANKEEMIKACNTLFKTAFEPVGYERTGVDNIADAAFLLDVLLHEYPAMYPGHAIVEQSMEKLFSNIRVIGEKPKKSKKGK